MKITIELTWENDIARFKKEAELRNMDIDKLAEQLIIERLLELHPKIVTNGQVDIEGLYNS